MRWMNEGRGREALGPRSPWEVYGPSPREWKACPEEPVYPGHWEVRRVRGTDELKLWGDLVFLSESRSGELVGLEEIDDRLWRGSYRRSVLCFVDRRRGGPSVVRGVDGASEAG